MYKERKMVSPDFGNPEVLISRVLEKSFGRSPFVWDPVAKIA